MEIQGRVVEIMPVQSGVGKNSGREWSSQEFIIEYNENTQYPRQACLRIFGQDRIAEINIQMGEYVNVLFDVESSKYLERWYTRLNVYRVTRIQPGSLPISGPRPSNQPDVPAYTLNDAPISVQRQVYGQQQGGYYQQPYQPQQQMYQGMPDYPQPTAPQPYGQPYQQPYQQQPVVPQFNQQQPVQQPVQAEQPAPIAEPPAPTATSAPEGGEEEKGDLPF